MDAHRKINAFFFKVESEISELNKKPDIALNNLIARSPVFFHKTMFRAFLNYSGIELEEMSMQEYIDCTTMLGHVLKTWHAPYINND